MISFLFLIAVAQSADYDHTTDFEVNLNAPPANNGMVSTNRLAVHITNPANLPDTVIQSSWAPLTCEIIDNDLRVVVAGNHQTWPTSLPSSGVATCTAVYGGSSYQLEVSLTQGTDARWNDGFQDFVNGYTLKAEDGCSIDAMNLLPDNGAYVTGTYPALLSPNSNWDDVLCRVSEDSLVSGRYWLAVSAFKDAETDIGYCKVYNSTNQLTGTVPVDFERY